MPFGGSFQEQPDLGLAKTIDGLHRVANREQRSAVARCQPAVSFSISAYWLTEVSWNSSIRRCCIR